MYLVVGTGADSFAQLITVLLIFIFVLALTLYTTKFIAKYQKSQGMGKNIEILETCRLNTNKYIQIVRIGETYVALAVCKDTVTVITEVSLEQMEQKGQDSSPTLSFKSILDRVKKAESDKDDVSK